jgi:hypothetical protein
MSADVSPSGGAPSDPPHDPHRRPDGASDAVVEAVGRLSEALEWVERARGRLYDLHQMMGHADRLFGEAAAALDAAGAPDQARLIDDEVVGRNVLDGRWTFQIVEEFDAGYYRAAKDAEHHVRALLMDGRQHVFEAEMKERRRTDGHPAHTRSPPG